jgi:hypothetical protein
MAHRLRPEDRIASDPETLRGSFEFYRAFDTTMAQNENAEPAAGHAVLARRCWRR